MPELISSIVHSTRMSIERDNVESIESSRTKSGGALTVYTVDGSAVIFRMPILVLQPLVETLDKEGIKVKNAETSVTQTEPV